MSTPPTTELQDYVGTYTNSDGTPFYLVVVDPEQLAVVVNGNVWMLRGTGADAFELVGVAERLRFDRDETGTVTAASDSKGTYSRQRAEVPEDVRALFAARDFVDYRYAPPQAAEADLPVGAAADHGISPDSLEAIVGDIFNHSEYRNFHSLLVARSGTLVLEEYFAGYTADRSHNLRSATKSVISALVGVAVQRGEVRLDDRPLQRIAEELGVPISAHKAQLQLAGMLNMRHGLQCDDWDVTSPGNESKLYGAADWTTAILNIPDATGDPAATYCSAMPLMVGRYLELVTGQSLPDYAERVLFTPLGIARTDWEWNFALSAEKNTHGAQVHLRPRDMLRFGYLYAADGRSAAGEQLLPPGWVAQTFAAEMPLGDWRRYNDFWWSYDTETADGTAVTVHMASGIGGQKIALVPALNLVVVMTGGSFSVGRAGPTGVLGRLVGGIANLY